MKKYAASIFKAYDIRGIVETELTPDVVEDIGKVLGTLALESKTKGLVVGCDGRLSSPTLSKSMSTGIMSAGCDVYDIGQVTTPMVYFANYYLETYSGVMITGSHNPPQYNGLKMVIGGKTLSGDDIKNILYRLQNGKYNDKQQAVYHTHDISDNYIEKITSDIKLKRQMSVIVDCGNGVAGNIVPKLYRRLGAKVLGLYCDVDGNFPNHHPDPSQLANLQDLIGALKSPGAEIGLAFDGDGDRLGVVTSDGKVIYPDRQMMVFAADILEKTPDAKIIYDVKSSRLLAKWIEDHGGQAVMSRTGHSFIKSMVQETGALLAGEMSGHIFFNDRWYGVDDGVYAGARLLEILSQIDDPSAVLNALPESVSTPEINIKVKEGDQHKIVSSLQQTAIFPTSQKIITLDGIRAEYSDGFGLVRASNTTPTLVLRFEAETQSGILRIQDEFRSALSSYVPNMTF